MTEPPAPTTNDPPAQGAGSARVGVAVVGGGIAGLTAALKLAQRGYDVTVFEKADRLGGNLSSSTEDGRRYDIYPHMYPSWYANFWTLFEDDLKLSREARFACHTRYKLRRKGQAGYDDLYNPSSLRTVWSNLTSGVLPMPDMFLFAFYMLDLAAQPFDEMSELSKLTVNGHIFSRPYATERVARFSDYILQLIWSIPSDRTSAPAYQDFVKHAFQVPNPPPFAWMLKGAIQTEIIAPLAARLAELGGRVVLNQAVVGVSLDGEAPILRLEGGDEVRPDHVVLAAPAPTLVTLAMTGTAGARLVDRVPALSRVAELRSVSIPVINIYFNRRLDDVPEEIVALLDTPLSLSVLDISQLWDRDEAVQGRTVLVVACSNAYAFPTLEPEERGWILIRELHAYMPLFRPGAFWGDPDSDIDWTRTLYIPNDTHPIYTDHVGDDQAAPDPTYAALPRVCFAGDFCKTDVRMATIEAAVQSGVQAAMAIEARSPLASPKGSPIAMAPHKVFSDRAFMAAKLALLPLAYAATAWSEALEPRALRSEVELPPHTPSAAATTLMLPGAFVLDWWKTAYWLGKETLQANRSDTAAGRGSGRGAGGPIDVDIAPDDLAGLGVKLLGSATGFLNDVARRLAEARAGAAEAPEGPPPGRYRRHWRVKA